MQLNSLRNRKQALKLVQELDAFPKVPESYQETTATGGGGMYFKVLCIALGTDVFRVFF